MSLLGSHGFGVGPSVLVPGLGRRDVGSRFTSKEAKKRLVEIELRATSERLTSLNGERI